MTTNKKIYFVSDIHLGYPNFEGSLKREKLLVKWLDTIKQDASDIYLMGDVFDFWFEYKHVIRRGFTRFLGKLSELSDYGIKIHFFAGNHDIWLFDYLEQEIGLTIYREPTEVELMGKKFYLAHGDGLGPFDQKFKLLKKIFTSKTMQWFFARIHPNTGIALANYWSRKSRMNQGDPEVFKGLENEWLYIYSKNYIKKSEIDYFVYGHRHIIIDEKLDDKSTLFILGDWLHNFSYGIFDGEKMRIIKGFK